jgi:hypothetical protein
MARRVVRPIVSKCRSDKVRAEQKQRKEPNMLWTITTILIVLWLLGLVSSYTMGGYIHLLLILAVIIILVRLIQGQRPL